MPRLRLWISRIKISEKRGVGKVGKTRRIVRKRVERARHVVFKRDIAVEALVHRMLAEKRRGGRRGSNGASSVPKKGSEIVGGRAQGALTHVKTPGGNIVVEKSAEEFQLGVVEGTPGIVGGGEVAADRGVEWDPPYNRNWRAGKDADQRVGSGGGDSHQGLVARDRRGVREPDPTGAEARRVVSAGERGGSRDKLE